MQLKWNWGRKEKRDIILKEAFRHEWLESVDYDNWKRRERCEVLERREEEWEIK